MQVTLLQPQFHVHKICIMIDPVKIKISGREKEVLKCLAEGMTTHQTARKLYLSYETIKTHRSNLLNKFDAKNAFQLGLKTSIFDLAELH